MDRVRSAIEALLGAVGRDLGSPACRQLKTNIRVSLEGVFPASADAETFREELEAITATTVWEDVIESLDRLTSLIDKVQRSSKRRSQLSGCPTCRKPLAKGQPVKLFQNQVFHRDCFICASCPRVVVEEEFLVAGDRPLCTACSPKCHACLGTISRDHVNVLDRHYHRECVRCVHCNMVVGNFNKIYARHNEPCCPKCVQTVFRKRWSPRLSTRLETHETGDSLFPKDGSWSKDKTVRDSVAGLAAVLDRQGSEASEHHYASITDSGERLYEAPRPVPPPLPSRNRPLEASELETILKDDRAIDLLVVYCVQCFSVEGVAFWLDVEQFRNFDGTEDDFVFYAKAIRRKYIEADSDLSVFLPADMRQAVLDHDLDASRHIQDVFDEAQKYVYDVIEQTIIPGFLTSLPGRKYLSEMVPEEDLFREYVGNPKNFVDGAIITNFVKIKHESESKYYAYEVSVTTKASHHVVLRRYSQFHRLHQLLAASLRTPPAAFPPKIFLGRSAIRSVAERRMVDLNEYLVALLRHPEAPSHPEVVMFFSKQHAARSSSVSGGAVNDLTKPLH